MNNLKFSGLKTALNKFNNNGKYVKCMDWSIASGGYDLWWEIYYQDYTVLQCVDGELIGGFRPIPEFNDKMEVKLIEKVKNIYTDIK